jgi:hypothetical protein
MIRPEPIDNPLPSRTTPAPLASILKLWVEIIGNSLCKKIVVGVLDGKRLGSKVIRSPGWAADRACRNVPEPLSAALVMTMVWVTCLGRNKLSLAWFPNG